MDDFSFATLEQEQERGRQVVSAQTVADQLAWDRFAAGVLAGGFTPAEACHIADLMMLERAKRLTPRKG